MSSIARGLYRFVDWTLTAMASMAVRYHGKCLTCGELSTETADSGEAQLWCLKHAGMTGHTGYELAAFQCFDAAPTRPGESCPEQPTN